MLLDLNLNPSQAVLRRFGQIGLVVFSAVGIAAALGGTPVTGPAQYIVAGVAWAVAGACVLGSVFNARWNRPLFVTMTMLTYPIGYAVSFVVMTILFVAVLTPSGLLARALGRDPITRTIDKSAASYWISRKQPDARRYFKLY